MGLTIKAEVEGYGAATNALRGMPLKFRRAASKEMVSEAERLANAARRGVRRHPSGLWKDMGAAYQVKKKGLLNVGVRTPSGEVGAAEAVTEFASRAYRPQGRAMVSVLNRYYGRSGGSGGGRVLWSAYDADEDAYVAAMERIVAQTCAEYESELG